ncbi:unnamed protein product [Paramecium primaurelia]|uniref:Pre-rRNA-processing protein TSR2 homolog n=1 Tax=Paramecium primaurelia TaxID=5886 RepID=A0A8S1Q8G8_PARPR|nr:unnamed protein product [Paramecium primaurelia]
MLKELEKYRVPDNFTGARLQIACTQIIDSWVALKLAFEHQTQTIQESPENIKKLMAYQLAAYIYNCETEIDDLVQFLSVYLEQYLQLIIEDNSDRYIAERLLDVFNDLEQDKEGKYLKLLEDIRVYNEQNKNVKHVANIEDSDEESDNEEQPPQLVQQQQQQMQVEEEEDDVDSDGYETVKPKKRYNKRN